MKHREFSKGKNVPKTTFQELKQRSENQPERSFKNFPRWSIILATSFIVILAAGHFYAGTLVLLLTVLVYREIVTLKRDAEKDKKLPEFFLLRSFFAHSLTGSFRWYFFALAVYGTGSFWVIPAASSLGLLSTPMIDVLENNHFTLTYMGGFVGFILFLMSLRRYTMRYQFAQFSLLILTCLFVVAQGMFHIRTIYLGLGWFILSTSAVIINDVSAYLCGKAFGKTPLTRLSPNKTIEGFLGAATVTFIWTSVLSQFLFKHEAFICPVETIQFRPFFLWTGLTCHPNPVYLARPFAVPSWLTALTGLKKVDVQPAWLHSFMIWVFAAFIAPFGGFFASAVKRTLKVKDFGDSIPGHGGITDRFDCQVVMGIFTYLYLKTFVLPSNPRAPTVHSILRSFDFLSDHDKLYFLQSINETLPYKLHIA